MPAMRRVSSTQEYGPRDGSESRLSQQENGVMNPLNSGRYSTDLSTSKEKGWTAKQTTDLPCDSSEKINVAEWLGFFFAGAINNTSYVIMLAGAKHIEPSLVGTVYICNVVPSLLTKLTGPYWFHYISYKTRMVIMTLFMTASFILVALGSEWSIPWMQLVGVAIGSVQSGFGEASFLAMTTFYAGRSSVTAWSSGTGLAGPFGYLWVIVFVQVFKVDFSVTLLSALVMPVAFWLNYAFLLGSPVITREKAKSIPSVSSGSLSDHSGSGSERHGSHSGELYEASDSPTPKTEESKYKDPSEAILSMTFRERVSRTLDLWPFTVPLFSVYLAEYAMQSGPWAAIGFPIDSKSARDRFYEYSNFAYQGGVLVSRSSGLIYKADMAAIWTMPVLQSIMLGFFIAVAYMQFWYNNWLLIMCFGVGLLGGSVYVGGFSLMRETVAPELKEFSLSAASFADGLGIVIASFIGGAIQKALYNYYDINDSGN